PGWLGGRRQLEVHARFLRLGRRAPAHALGERVEVQREELLRIDAAGKVGEVGHELLQGGGLRAQVVADEREVVRIVRLGQRRGGLQDGQAVAQVVCDAGR